jgi:YD repeat-containing protein
MPPTVAAVTDTAVEPGSACRRSPGDGPDAAVGYAWDAVGHLTEMTYPAGEVVQRAYDDAGQITSTTMDVGIGEVS